MTPERCAEILSKKLTAQIEYYSSLAELSQQQQQAVVTGEFNQLASLVEKREKVLRDLKITNRVAECYRVYWNKTSDQVSTQLFETVNKQFARLLEVLETLRVADRQLRQQATAMMRDMRSTIGMINQGRVVASAYSRPQLQPLPRYISKLSK